MKTKSSSSQETQVPSSQSRMGLVRYLVIAMIMTISSAYGQARLTNPTAGSQLPHPNFILTWNNVGASEYYISLGSRQGLSDHFGSSTGRNTSVGITWQVGRPVGVWVRVWSRVRVNSWTWSEQWVFSDSYHPLAQPPVNPASALIDSFLSTATAGRPGSKVGQCKEFLQLTFNQASRAFRFPNGAQPIMPRNDSQNGFLSNWQWVVEANSGFYVVGQVSPTLNTKDKQIQVLNLLRQIRKGDVLQCVWKTPVSSSGTEVGHYGPHTMAFRQDYSAIALDVVHSNMDGQGSLQFGTTTVWGTITPSSLAIRIGAQMGGCTLYRVRSDVQRR